MARILLPLWLVFQATLASCANDSQVIDGRLHHLRINGPREWLEFPEQPESTHLGLRFTAQRNRTEHTLRMRQQDVKQAWIVSLNGTALGQLHVDENDTIVIFPIPAGVLVDGENVLRVEQDVAGRAVPDDIRVGEIRIDRRTVAEVLGESTLSLEVVDAESGLHLPARLTIVNKEGALQTAGAASNRHLAVRPGVIYTSTGQAQVSLPAGKYTIFAGRGFEYSLAQAEVVLAAHQSVRRRLSIRREVPTAGYVACDPHVHTLTHSGHGDATVHERMITLAAEGIELPVATDHNVHIDHHPFAEAVGVRQYFTPVIGNEVTTRLGHFNVFPIAKYAKVPNHDLRDWDSIFAEIFRTPGVRVVILNHGRDIHSGVRPLGPRLHNGVVGENVEGWPAGMNAMEVINSAATQTDVMQLFHDWMGFLNRGRLLTPVGSSDSHDVARHFVGQGRTYIRCDDSDPSAIDVQQAVDSFLKGQVMVSYGLLTELTVEGKYHSGDLVAVDGELVEAKVRVLAPHWSQASRLLLFANGQLMRDESVPANPGRRADGVQWEATWQIAVPQHDVHLVAIAVGPGISGLYWKTAKPYQSTSPRWQPQTIGCSGAVWLDVDGDGHWTSAYAYARRIFASANGDLEQLLTGLSNYDRAVASQAAHLYHASGGSWFTDEAQTALKTASVDTREGIRTYLNAWRENQIARAKR